MKAIWIGVLLFCIETALAQEPIRTPAEAFNAGKVFAQDGKAAASGKVNATIGKAELPHYGTTAAETQHFQGGRNPIGDAGKKKQTLCASQHALNGLEQQECDAVNFLVKNPDQRPKYVIDKKTDPLLTDSKGTIEKPGTIPGNTEQRCRVETIKTPGTFIEETCTEAYGLDDLTCDKVLVIKQRPGCQPGQYLGRVITNACSHCTDPYVTGDVYCAGTEMGYTMSVWTSRTPDGNTPHSQLFANRPVPGRVGLSQGNTFIGDFGNNCHFPFYYRQACNETECTMTLSLIGSTCNGRDFEAPGRYQIPFSLIDTWDDQCGTLDGRTR